MQCRRYNRAIAAARGRRPAAALGLAGAAPAARGRLRQAGERGCGWRPKDASLLKTITSPTTVGLQVLDRRPIRRRSRRPPPSCASGSSTRLSRSLIILVFTSGRCSANRRRIWSMKLRNCRTGSRPGRGLALEAGRALRQALPCTWPPRGRGPRHTDRPFLPGFQPPSSDNGRQQWRRWCRRLPAAARNAGGPHGPGSENSWQLGASRRRSGSPGIEPDRFATNAALGCSRVHEHLGLSWEVRPSRRHAAR